jgi:hypothetical protein
VDDADAALLRQGDRERASVTVSMADETMGMLRKRSGVSRAARFASRGSTFEWAGNSTSSNVSDFWTRASLFLRENAKPATKTLTCGRSLAAARPCQVSAKLRPNEQPKPT